MRLREDILAFQKIFEDLKNTGQTYIKRKYHMWSSWVISCSMYLPFPIIRKKKYDFAVADGLGLSWCFTVLHGRQIEDCPEIDTVSQYGWRQFSSCTELCDLWKTAKNVQWYVV